MGLAIIPKRPSVLSASLRGRDSSIKVSLSHSKSQHLSPRSLKLIAAETASMGDSEVKIDKEVFNNRLSHFYTSWKNDKRSSGDAVFGGVGSILVLMGRNEEIPTFAKSNALSVYPRMLLQWRYYTSPN